jgi:hypothetical protein
MKINKIIFVHTFVFFVFIHTEFAVGKLYNTLVYIFQIPQKHTSIRFFFLKNICTEFDPTI